MYDSIGRTAPGPDQQQNVLACWGSMHLAGKLLCALDGMTVDFENYIARRESRIFRRTGWPNALNSRSVDLSGDVQFLAHFGREIVDRDPNLCAVLIG